MATRALHAGDDLQAAVNSAAAGDILVLDAGASWKGPICLPVFQGSQPITIQTSGIGSLPAGQRIGPQHAQYMAAILSTGGGQGCLYTADAAHNWTIIGIEFKMAAKGSEEFALVSLGNNGPSGPYPNGQTSQSQVPKNLSIDRCLFRSGFPGPNGQEVRRAISLHSASTDIVGCHISDIKNSNSDCQAIHGANGPGPYTIINCYLEASGENILFGGDYQKISGMIPSDITIQNCDFVKPLEWNPFDGTGSWRQGHNHDGSRWSVKNLLELKSAQRVLVDNCRFQNCWLASQAGWAMLLTPRGGDQGGTWTTVADVTLTNNIIRGSLQGIVVLGSDDANSTQRTTNLTIRNNLFEDIGDQTRYGNPGGPPHFLHIQAGVNGGVNGMTIDHNTFTSATSYTTLLSFGGSHNGVSFTNNLGPFGAYGIWSNDQNQGGISGLSSQLPGASFAGNVIWLSPGTSLPGNYLGNPDKNYYPTSVTAVGFNNYNNGRGGDYLLSASSSFKGKATDGKDSGCNLASPLPPPPPTGTIATTTTFSAPSQIQTGDQVARAKVTVTAKDGSVVTGDVQMDYSNFGAFTHQLNNGSTEYTLYSLPARTYTLQASYPAQGKYLGSTSSPQILTVGSGPPPPQIPTFTSVLIPAVTSPGSATATVAVTSASGIPTGSVSIAFDIQQTIAQPLVGGQSVFTIPSPAIGTHQLKASYAGQGSFLPSNANATFEVKPPGPLPGIQVPVNLSTLAQPLNGQAIRWKNTGREILYVFNGGTADLIYSGTYTNGQPYRVTLGAGQSRMLGPLTSGVYSAPDGTVTINFNTCANIKALLFLPR